MQPGNSLSRAALSALPHPLPSCLLGRASGKLSEIGCQGSGGKSSRTPFLCFGAAPLGQHGKEKKTRSVARAHRPFCTRYAAPLAPAPVRQSPIRRRPRLTGSFYVSRFFPLVPRRAKPGRAESGQTGLLSSSGISRRDWRIFPLLLSPPAL